MPHLGERAPQDFIPYNGKIADITHADALKHTLTLADATGTGAIPGETRKVVAIICCAVLMAGAGTLNSYPNEGAVVLAISSASTACQIVVIADNTQRLQYALTVAGNDFDLYCFGYIVEV